MTIIVNGGPFVPDVPFEPSGFAESWWIAQRRRSAFEDHLLGAGDGNFDFISTGTDEYDSSLEIFGVTQGYKLTDKQQRLIFDCGFAAAFVNYDTGPGAYYRWNKTFSVITEPGECSNRKAEWKVCCDPKKE